MTFNNQAPIKDMMSLPSLEAQLAVDTARIVGDLPRSKTESGSY